MLANDPIRDVTSVLLLELMRPVPLVRVFGFLVLTFTLAACTTSTAKPTTSTTRPTRHHSMVVPQYQRLIDVAHQSIGVPAVIPAGGVAGSLGQGPTASIPSSFTFAKESPFPE